MKKKASKALIGDTLRDVLFPDDTLIAVWQDGEKIWSKPERSLKVGVTFEAGVGEAMHSFGKEGGKKDKGITGSAFYSVVKTEWTQQPKKEKQMAATKTKEEVQAAVTVVEYKAKDGTDVVLSKDVILKFLVSGKADFVTDQELVYYMGACKARGLNPFKKDCYLVKYSQNDPAAIIVSIDYLRARASAHPMCQGWSKGPIVMRGGEIYYSSGLVIEEDKLLGGWCSVSRKGWAAPFMWEAPVAPFIKKTKDGQVTKFWQLDKQPFMITKVAEAQALRTVFADDPDTQHMYVDSEFSPPQPENDIDVTEGAEDEAPVAKAKAKAAKGKPNKVPEPGYKDFPPSEPHKVSTPVTVTTTGQPEPMVVEYNDKTAVDDMFASKPVSSEVVASVAPSDPMNPHPEVFELNWHGRSIQAVALDFMDTMVGAKEEGTTLEILDAIMLHLTDVGSSEAGVLADQLTSWIVEE